MARYASVRPSSLASCSSGWVEAEVVGVRAQRGRQSLPRGLLAPLLDMDLRDVVQRPCIAWLQLAGAFVGAERVVGSLERLVHDAQQAVELRVVRLALQHLLEQRNRLLALARLNHLACQQRQKARAVSLRHRFEVCQQVVRAIRLAVEVEQSRERERVGRLGVEGEPSVNLDGGFGLLQFAVHRGCAEQGDFVVGALLQHALVEHQRLGVVAALLGEARLTQQGEHFAGRLGKQLVIQRSSLVFAPLTRQKLRILAHELGLLGELL
jgi:hypothetical protein